jgi:hypothetical protein
MGEATAAHRNLPLNTTQIPTPGALPVWPRSQERGASYPSQRQGSPRIAPSTHALDVIDHDRDDSSMETDDYTRERIRAFIANEIQRIGRPATARKLIDQVLEKLPPGESAVVESQLLGWFPNLFDALPPKE